MQSNLNARRNPSVPVVDDDQEDFDRTEALLIKDHELPTCASKKLQVGPLSGILRKHLDDSLNRSGTTLASLEQVSNNKPRRRSSQQKKHSDVGFKASSCGDHPYLT